MVWFFSGNAAKMPERMFGLIEDGANDIYVSIASIWELSIKYSLGKINLPLGIDQSFKEEIEKQGMSTIDITFEHAAEVATLPFVHRDPFDRLMIAQCRVEGFKVITDDGAWRDARYGVEVVW